MGTDEEKTYEAHHMRLTREDVEGKCDLLFVPGDNFAVGLNYTALPCQTPTMLYFFQPGRQIASLHSLGQVTISEETIRAIGRNRYKLDGKVLKLSQPFDGTAESLLRILTNPFE